MLQESALAAVIEQVRLRIISRLDACEARPLREFHILYNVWNRRWEFESGALVDMPTLVMTLDIEQSCFDDYARNRVAKISETDGVPSAAFSRYVEYGPRQRERLERPEHNEEAV